MPVSDFNSTTISEIRSVCSSQPERTHERTPCQCHARKWKTTKLEHFSFALYNVYDFFTNFVTLRHVTITPIIFTVQHLAASDVMLITHQQCVSCVRLQSAYKTHLDFLILTALKCSEWTWRYDNTQLSLSDNTGGSLQSYKFGPP